jgi:putative DNA primase/helicase
MAEDQIRESLNGASDYKSERAGLRVLNLRELLELNVPARDPVLEPIIREKDLVMLHSWRGVGKTQVGFGMAFAVAAGGSFLRWSAPKPRRVLYVDGELPIQTVQGRFAQLVAALEKTSPDPNPEFLQIITPDAQEDPMPNLATAEGQTAIDEKIALLKTDMVFIDSLSTLARHGRANDEESWIPVQEWMLKLRRRGLAVVLIHHEGKGGTQRGTSKKEDILDTVIRLVRPADYSANEGARFEVHLEKARALWGDPANPFEARLENQDGKAVWTTRDIEDVILARSVELFKEGMSVREVAEELKTSKSSASRLRSKAVECGLLKS